MIVTDVFSGHGGLQGIVAGTAVARSAIGGVRSNDRKGHNMAVIKDRLGNVIVQDDTKTLRELVVENKTHLAGAYLCGVDLRGLDLSHADLRSAEFNGCKFAGVNLSNANPSCTTFNA